ncbi:uncharacterized protein M421DRAFT_289725 [Didymella exigua CBS 183.55]|uniref:DUF7918 domain-containing protein n=1 Tax=Didymella exigua CBS 183.55 TaxID=1150837 RepID=A0A6A5RV63_9PLEO|nr:uncharacterized protein M421DRAFT_289725 [Didymella exigua CBS 183.55]KAF1932341.1 hypothetical protein M421DRAFT_289725 [Didymella exigua CBS 183.55]
MPLLKDLSCSIELSDDQEVLQELGTVYGDAFVETFVPVPKKQQTFTVHLSGRNFIAPGIAMYVFIDGVYQCNRNRQNMKLRRPLDRRSLVDFKVRQKEERQKDGSMIAREWTFEKLDHASADDAPDSCSSNILESLGCIEVVVLRCAGPRDAKTAPNMNMDGAVDYPDYRSDRDSRSRTTAYDDRDPFVGATSNKRPPPPPASQYRSPYAETVRSREHSNKARSRYSEPVSPSTHLQRDIPAPGFQYGSGPLPARSTAETYKELVGDRRASQPTPAVDPGMLEKIVVDAVKRGVEESRKSQRPVAESQIGSGRYWEDLDGSSQVPGAWPTTPTQASTYCSSRSEYDYYHDDNDGLWEENTTGRKHRSAKSRTACVGWDKEPKWDTQTKADGWGSADEASWNTDETWPEKRPESWGEVRKRSKSRARTARGPSPPRRVPHVSERPPQRQHSKHGSQKSRSKSRSYWVDDMKTSTDDKDSWTQNEAPSDTSTSLGRSDSTLRPSHSRSQIQQERSTSGRKSSRRGQSQSRHRRRLSQPVENPRFYPEKVHAGPPSMLVTNAPTVVSAPIWQNLADVQSRNPGIHTQIAAPVVAPPPTWGCASEKARRKSAGTTYLPPAPFSAVGEDHQRSRHSSGSSSWGVENKKASKHGSGKKSSLKQANWGGDNAATGWNDEQAKGWGDDAAAGQKNDEWNTAAPGDGGRGVSNDAEPKRVDWNADNNNNGWGAAQDTTTAWDQPQDDTNEAPFDANAGDAWATPVAVEEKPSEKVKPRSAGKRHTTKSLSKYRRLSPASLVKPHWRFPPTPPSKTLLPTEEDGSEHSGRARRMRSVPSEPLHKIPQAAAAAKGVEHQVLAGPGTAYGHAVSRPEYVDGLDKPYAVFRFKYRSRSALKGMFGRDCLRGTGSAPGAAGKEELEALPQEQLVSKMLALQRRLAERDCRGGASRCSESVAMGLTQEWVQQQSRQASEKGVKGIKAGTEKSAEKVAGWDDGAKATGWDDGAKATRSDTEKVAW